MMNKDVLLFHLIVFLSLGSALAQEGTNFQKAQGKLATYASLNAPEKVYLQTDKDHYSNGETIWFMAYILDGIVHTPSQKSNVVYVDLLDSNDSLIAQRKLFADFLGTPGDIEIANNVDEGNYQLRTYTQYMLNSDTPTYFHKEIRIWVLDSIRANASGNLSPEQIQKVEFIRDTVSKLRIGKPIVQFFPEGGDLVNGLDSSVGLKVTDGQGNGIALEGKISDQNGNTVASFRSYDFGLGVTQFTPEAGKTYNAIVSIKGEVEKYRLPKPLQKGYVTRVRNQGDYLLIQVSTNNQSGLEGTMLLGHLRGKLFFKRIGEQENENTYTLKLLTAELDDGVAQFTLFAQNGEPVCERLVFIDNPNNDVMLSVNTDRKDYGFREPVTLDLKLADKHGSPLEGNLSLGVVSENALSEVGHDIRSWLLLNSDLGGTLENPGYFFEDSSYARKYLLDVLMLTHGWRRFIWKEMLAQNVTPRIPFPPEKGIMITGKTTAFENRYQPKKALTSLSLFGQEIYHEEKETNAQGGFSYGPLIFQDSIEAIVNAMDIDRNKKRKSEFSIYIDPPVPKFSVVDSTRRKLHSNTITYPQQYLETTLRKKVADFKYDSKVTQLKEVVVEAKKKSRQELINEEIDALTLYGNAQNRLFPDSIPGTAASSAIDVLRRVAGVRVIGTYPNQTVQIRGGATPLFLMDGMPVDLGFISNMRASEVMFIDVLKGAEAVIYGSRAANGVVAVYTKRALSFDLEQERYPGVTNFKVHGFYKTREFFSPNYAEPKPEHKKPDYRTTLYWEPEIEVNGKQPVTLQFYTGDSSGKYRIKIEGITKDGRPVMGVYELDVEED